MRGSKRLTLRALMGRGNKGSYWNYPSRHLPDPCVGGRKITPRFSAGAGSLRALDPLGQELVLALGGGGANLAELRSGPQGREERVGVYRGI